MKVIDKKVKNYVGKEYEHRGTENSFDCLSLVISILNDFGYDLPWDDGRTISEDWYQEDPLRLIRGLAKYGKRISSDKLQPLDVVVFSFSDIPRHCGLMISRSKMIHARTDKKTAIIRIKHYKRFLHSYWRMEGGENI